MTIRVTFKTPDAVSYALDRVLDCNDPEEFEQAEVAQKAIDKFVRYGEYITVEFDTDKGTATVVPV